MGCVHSKPEQRDTNERAQSREGRFWKLLSCCCKGNCVRGYRPLAETLETELETDQAQQVLELEHRLEDHKEKLAGKEAEIQHLQQSLEQQESEKRELHGRLSELEGALAMSKQDQLQREEDVVRLQKERDSLHQTLQDAETHIAALETQVSELESQIKVKDRLIAAKEQELHGSHEEKVKQGEDYERKFREKESEVKEIEQSLGQQKDALYRPLLEIQATLSGVRQDQLEKKDELLRMEEMLRQKTDELLRERDAFQHSSEVTQKLITDLEGQIAEKDKLIAASLKDLQDVREHMAQLHQVIAVQQEDYEQKLSEEEREMHQSFNQQRIELQEHLSTLQKALVSATQDKLQMERELMTLRNTVSSLQMTPFPTMTGTSDSESWLPTIHTCYHKSFFLLRIPISVNGKPAEIKLREDGSPTLNCCYNKRSISVNLSAVSHKVARILLEHGVYHTDTFYYEQVPLFSINFSSKSCLRDFLVQMKSDIRVALNAALSEHLTEEHKKPFFPESHQVLVPVDVDAELYLVSPGGDQSHAAKVEAVTLARCSHFTTQWKRGMVFDFQSLQLHGQQPLGESCKEEEEEEAELKDLLKELRGVTDWFWLGVNVDIPEERLLEIQMNHRQDTIGARKDVLIEWGKLERRTWSKTVRALQAIGKVRLAKQLCEKYGVTLPDNGQARDHAASQKLMSVEEPIAGSIRNHGEAMSCARDKLAMNHELLKTSKANRTVVKTEIENAIQKLPLLEKEVEKLTEEKKEIEEMLETKRLICEGLHSMEKQYEKREKQFKSETQLLQHLQHEKEEQIRDLEKKLQQKQEEIAGVEEELKCLKEQLNQKTAELEQKSVLVRDLERENHQLQSQFSAHKRSYEQELQQMAAKALSQEAYWEEVKLQLYEVREEADSKRREVERYKQDLDDHTAVITSLRLREEMKSYNAATDELSEDFDPKDRFVCEMMALRVKLVEAEAEKEELLMRVEAAGRDEVHLLECIVGLEMILTPDPQKCTAVSSGLEVAVTDQVAQFEVHLANTNGDPCAITQHVTAELKSIVNGSLIKAKVVNKTPATYEVSYQPSVRGRHDLSVRVNDTPIQGSPFRVYVRHPPHRLGKPVRVIGGLNKPIRMAINENGDMIVCESHRLGVYNKDGQRINPIRTVRENSTDYRLNPHGVAVDEDGNMYITNRISHRLFKITSDGKVLKSVGGRSGGYGYGYGDIALSKDKKVLVFDTKHNQCIYRVQIFGANLKFISCCIEGAQGQMFRGLATDSEGNLYVASWPGQIQVFSQSGTILRTITTNKTSGPYELTDPRGIHVDHDWVYVTNGEENCVLVFTTSGEFITSFGKHGNGEGEFSCPIGITTDEDGFVYVCDYSNHRIQVF